MSKTKKNINVLLTGFKPFSNHKVNPSWEAVKILENNGLGEKLDHVKLHCFEIPVLYEYSKEQIPQLWESVKPDLAVHVGVSNLAEQLTLEQQAHNSGYERSDTNNCLPSNGCCISGADHLIVSEIKMQEVCDYINKVDQGISAVVSNDAGRYLCDFTYFKSLSIDKRKSVFIHVPPLDQPYTLQQTANGIKTAIVSMLLQLNLVPSV